MIKVRKKLIKGIHAISTARKLTKPKQAPWQGQKYRDRII
jgi:hypothetical protein